MAEILVVAPHADDETLGCGGTLLRHRRLGDRIHWLLVTGMTPELGFPAERIQQRDTEIKQTANAYGFASVHQLKLPTTTLDSLPKADMVSQFEKVWRDVAPEVVYLPFNGDVHSDHRMVFEAAMGCTKWFRHPSVRRVLAYETLSETEFGLDPAAACFRPNVFIDISEHLDRKLNIMDIFAGETGEFPFPRSAEAIRAQAMLRGSQSGFQAAEAFMLLKETYGPD